MIQHELNEDNKETRRKAHELYEQHGFKDGKDFVDWLEAEKQTGKRSLIRHRRQLHGYLLGTVGLLCVIVLLLFVMLLRQKPALALSAQSLSDHNVMLLVLDHKPDEEVVAFGDTHFDFNNATLTSEARTQLDRNVQLMKDQPEMKVRIAGYTSAKGTKESNQGLSEQRASAVQSYVLEQGISPERITTIGYGRTRPALFEVTPGDTRSAEAKANMRVLFEIMVE